MNSRNPAAIFGEDISKDTLRDIVTPDNVKVTVRISDVFTRLAAGIIDFLFVQITVLLAILLFAYISSAVITSSGRIYYNPSHFFFVLALFLSFVFRITYFPLLEIKWQGQTIGKWLLNIKVVDRNGGPLKMEAVLIRNFVREVEFWLPLTLIIFRPSLEGGAGVNLAVMIFLMSLCLVPFSNRERMRGGDMLAGTWVIKVPKAELLSDLSQTRKAFTNAELGHYGIEELQTLDYVLRLEGQNAPQMQKEVANKIRTRIGRQPSDHENDKEFLMSFYTAQREYLENKQLLEGSAPVNKYNT